MRGIEDEEDSGGLGGQPLAHWGGGGPLVIGIGDLQRSGPIRDLKSLIRYASDKIDELLRSD